MSRRRTRRLAPDVRPTHVDLALEVDPTTDDRFSGSVSLDLSLEKPRRFIELHAAEIRVDRARIEVGRERLTGKIERRPEHEMIRVRLPRPAGPGKVRLELSFRGKLRPDLKGFYHAQSGRHRYALTQLAANHARRVFPCFDEPAMKARFQVSVTTRKGLTVIGNQPVTRVEAAGRGTVTHHFSRTPPLSSYLVALAIGRFESSRSVKVGRTPIRVWHVPGKAHLASFALRAARASLERLEDWFGLAHPYDKIDLVAVPDFEFGAMENAGAVFFRETALLLDPKTANASEQKRVAEVVAHELSHMWFGNLVTMAWWDDLWLNESFATWMAYHVIDDWKPEWGMWRGFRSGTAAALQMDALADTHPVYSVVHDVDRATENFDLITYEKGAAIVRMIERTLGAAFRRGVRRYIRDHAEGNTVAADLWQALGTASGTDVLRMAGAWIEQAGHPLIEVRRADDGRHVRLEQRPFRLERRRGAIDPAARWPVAWSGLALGPRGTGARVEAPLTGRRTRAPLPPAVRGRPLYGNAEQDTFCRTLHTPAELAAIGERAAALGPVERMGLADDAWALARAGELPLAAFLELFEALGRDADPYVLGTLRGALLAIDRELVPGLGAAAQARWRRRVADAVGPAPRSSFGRTRGRTDALEALAHRLAILGGPGGSARVASSAGSAARAYLKDPGSLHPAFADVAVNLAAEHGDASLFARLDRARRRATAPQLARRATLALTRFREPELFERALAQTLDPEFPSGDVAVQLVAAFANPTGAERTWRFTKRHWRALERRMGAMLVTRVIKATTALGTREARDDVAAFFRAHPVATGDRAIRTTRAGFDLAIDFRRRALPQLDAWLMDGAQTPRTQA